MTGNTPSHFIWYTRIMSTATKKNCDMCLMPFSQDPGVRDTDNYCSYCHHDGEFTYKGNDVNEFKAITYQQMREHGIGHIKARFFTWMIGFAPHWKRVRNET